ncbi:hypothetical protein LPN04_23080 [Rugamonas sp. A1-17]|nr:hypothetical protein [Rugamonas sp. A1-17]
MTIQTMNWSAWVSGMPSPMPKVGATLIVVGTVTIENEGQHVILEKIENTFNGSNLMLDLRIVQQPGNFPPQKGLTTTARYSEQISDSDTKVLTVSISYKGENVGQIDFIGHPV